MWIRHSCYVNFCSSPCNPPSVQYETKWVSERSVWMLRSDALLRYSFFYSGDNNYRNAVVSFCNTVLLLINDFFSTPIANQKKVRYNMTKRTEMVIFQGGCSLGFYRLRDWAAPQGVAERNETLCCHVGDEENLSGSTDKGCRYRKRLIL